VSLLWHIFLKDLRRLRLPLAIWSTLQLLAQLGPGFVWSLPTLTAKETEFLLYTLAGIHALSWLAAFDFAIRLIQVDSAARSDAFWRTRPISGLRLLAAKLLALVLFIALAALPALLSTLVSSTTPHASASALIEVTIQTHLVLATLAVPFAALTRSYRQSLLLSVAAFILIVVVTAWIHLVYDPAGTDLYQPRMTLAALIMLTATVVILINQYITCRLARSLRIAALVTLATTLILAFWPWRFPLLQPSLPLASDEPAETRALALAYGKASLWNEAEGGPKSTRPVLNLDFAVSGFPSGHFLRRKGIYHHWQDAAAPSFRRPGSSLTPNPDARVILGLLPSPAPLASINLQSQIPETFAARLRAHRSPAAYRADLVFDLRRAEITEIPLRPGQSVSTTDGDIRLIQIDPGTATLRLLERSAGPRKRLVAVITNDNQFILYNPRTGTALRSSSSETLSAPWIKQHELTFASIVGPNVTNRAKPLTDDFFRDARLVKISFPVVGSFARTVHVDALRPYISR
jgi:hypothetical protein